MISIALVNFSFLFYCNSIIYFLDFLVVANPQEIQEQYIYVPLDPSLNSWEKWSLKIYLFPIFLLLILSIIIKLEYSRLYIAFLFSFLFYNVYQKFLYTERIWSDLFRTRKENVLLAFANWNNYLFKIAYINWNK